VSLLRDERGQASVEFVGMLWLLFLVALVVWQLLLAAWTAEQAQNAARTGSRVLGRGGDAGKAARMAVSSGLRRGMQVRVAGEQVRVTVRIPILVPGLHIDTDTFKAERDATLPDTGSAT
jgi:Flp pilus assembly protein TadG